MIRKLFLLFILICCPLWTWAESWDYITSSGQYYYGVGRAATIEEANNAALADLVGQIATHVSSDFRMVDDETTTNGQIDHKSRVLNCVKTYSQATLTNVKRMPPSKDGGMVTVRIYMEQGELQKVFKQRTDKALDMIDMGDQCMKNGQIDMALQYYYWAYSLIRSVQFPAEVKGSGGEILVNRLPMRMENILRNIEIRYEGRSEDCVEILAFYEGKPVPNLEVLYTDGNTDDCPTTIKDGHGIMELAPGYQPSAFHLRVAYESPNLADEEVKSVLNVLPRHILKGANFKLEPTGGTLTQREVRSQTKQAEKAGIHLKPQEKQLVTESEDYADIIAKIIDASRGNRLGDMDRYFTVDGGLPRYRDLMKYGKARVIGTPNIVFFKSSEGKVVARGLQMSFTFTRGRKKSFVEDVVFTFNKDKKIDNITFGLGQTAENDILCQRTKWKPEIREQVMEFLENYKTAYSLKELNYIRDIYADDAVIITGRVTKRVPNISRTEQGMKMSLEGENIISYNRQNKEQYLANLERCFRRNEFINLRFTHNQIQHLEKFSDKEIFGIQIGQEYHSSTYSDIGYLFLLVDLTNHEEPVIKVRTWQPNETSMDKLFHAGDFYR